MYTLQMLGGISLTDEAGAEVDALLRQSKHVALLAYLASPKPGTWHKRDSVIGAFWAEHDQTRARSAFRSALYTLRGHLPDNAIRSRGDNDLSVDPQIVRTDTAAMADLLERREYAQALALYKGEFLPGIYVADAAGFDQWLEQERRRTRDMASEAARQLSKKLESEKDESGAIRAARHNYDLDPDDEGTARRLITLLDQSGDRAQAFAVYEEFRNHIYEAFGVRPSAETVALLDAIRTRHEPLQNPVATAKRVVEPVPQTPPAHETAAAPKRSTTRAVALAAIPLAIAVVAWTMWPREKVEASAAARGRTMVVLPATNDTGDPSVDYLTTGIAEDLSRQLSEIGGFVIKSAAKAQLSNTDRSDLRKISRVYDAGLILRTSLKKSGDSLLLAGGVIDAATMTDEPIEPVAFSQQLIEDVESKIVAKVAGAVFQKEFIPQKPKYPVDAESKDLTLQGFYQLLSDTRVARGQASRASLPDPTELFTRAKNIDPNNARAWAGLSSAIASRVVSDQIPFDDGYIQATTAANTALALDSTQGTALANIGILRALKLRKLSAGLPFIQRAAKVDPGNPEVFLIKSVMYRNAHMWDKSRDAIRVAQRLDPLSPYYEREALIAFCEGRPEVALALYRQRMAVDSTDGIVRAGTIRALAMLGRYDEALASWRADPKLKKNPALRDLLATAKSPSDYWNARHLVGRARLDSMMKAGGRISLVQFMRAAFAAGDSAKAFEAADKILDQQLAPMYRLACMPDHDEYRNAPRFKALVARAGALPP